MRLNASLVELLNDALERLWEEDFFADLYRKCWDTNESNLGRGETNVETEKID